MMSTLHRCMQAAKRQRNINIFRYFEEIYESEPHSDHMFIGLHELCTLTSKKACAANTHTDCLAAKFIDAYNQLKVVMMVGEVTLHVPVNLEMETGKHKQFHVVKVRRRGQLRCGGPFMFLHVAVCAGQPQRLLAAPCSSC